MTTTPWRTLIAAALVLALAALTWPAAAQYDVTRTGGPACWRVMGPGGEVSRHILETEAQAAATTAGDATGVQHGYINPCYHRVSVPGAESPTAPPGAQIGQADVAFTLAEGAPGSVSVVRACYSLDGGETFPMCGRWALDVPWLPAATPGAVRVRLVVPPQ